MEKFGIIRRYHPAIPIKDCICFTLFAFVAVGSGSGKSSTARTLSGSFPMPFALITWPRTLISVWQKLHLRSLIFSPESSMQDNTWLRRWRCSSKDLPYITKSSRKHNVWVHRSPPRIESIILWKAEGQDLIPMGITLNSHFPSIVAKQLFGLLSSSRSTWKNPAWRSAVENQDDPSSLVSTSCTLGRG